MSDSHHPLCSKLRRMPECDCWARAAVDRTAYYLGGYSVEIRRAILAGDYSAVSSEDRPIFERAIADARRL